MPRWSALPHLILLAILLVEFVLGIRDFITASSRSKLFTYVKRFVIVVIV